MKNERFKQICHFTAGLLLIPIAYKLIEKTMFVHCAAFFAAGLFFLAISGGLEYIEKRVPLIEKLAYLAEAVALLAASFILRVIDHSKPMQIGYAVAGSIYILLFLYFVTGSDQQAKRRHKRRRHKHSHDHN